MYKVQIPSERVIELQMSELSRGFAAVNNFSTSPTNMISLSNCSDNCTQYCHVTKQIYFVTLLKQIFLVSTFHRVNLYTVLSTCNEVTFSCKYLRSTSLLCSQPCRYRSRNVPTFIKLNTSLPASAACKRLFSAAGRVFVPRRGRISDKRFEQQLLAYSISICCNDSRHCHAKDVIFILHGYTALDV